MTVWEVTTTDGQPRMSHEVAAGPVTAVAFARDGTVLAGAAFDKTIRLWDVATGKELGVLPKQAHIVATLAFSPDGQTLASGDRCGGVTLWDRTTGDVHAMLETAENKVFMNEVTALVFSPDGQTLAVAVERTVRLWEVASGRGVARLEGHAGKVKCQAFSPNGTRLASGGYDRTLRLWDVAQYRPMNP
jgi:WD40 repeat protein